MKIALLPESEGFHPICYINFLPDKNTTPGTAMGTDRNNIVAVATAMSLAVVCLLEGCLKPGWGNDGLISDPRTFNHDGQWHRYQFYSYLQEELREPSFFGKLG